MGIYIWDFYGAHPDYCAHDLVADPEAAGLLVGVLVPDQEHLLEVPPEKKKLFLHNFLDSTIQD